MCYVYVIRSLSHPKRHYIGFTEDIDQRLKEHNDGKSFHTAKYCPWQLAIYLAVPSKQKALELERYPSQALDGRFCSATSFERVRRAATVLVHRDPHFKSTPAIRSSGDYSPNQ